MGISFEELGLSQELVKGLTLQDIQEPTKIQERVIPVALQGEDLIAESETGSGKTLAYLLPLFAKVQWDKKETQVIVLAPTHELAIQVNNQMKELAKNSQLPVTSAVVIGNVNIKKQIETVKKGKPHIIVGSPGRILELINMKAIKTPKIQTIVLDEADRLVDKNNINSVQDIIKTTLKDRQLMFFSATISAKTVNIAKELMGEYKLIKVEEKTALGENIKHMCFVSEGRDKILILRRLMHILKPQRAIAFINNSYDIKLTVERLRHHNLLVESTYGEADKEQRRDALNRFRTGKANLLVASDIAARGLDIKNVDYIFSMDISENPEIYLHRAGRTGRAGEKGTSICIITEREKDIIKSYEKAFGIKIEMKDFLRDAIVDFKPRKVKL